VRFEHCYAQPLCTPTRAQLMTGMSNVRNYVSFGRLAESQTTFAHLFRQAGYATGIFGKWQLGTREGLPKHFGFDEHCLWQYTRRPSRYASPGLEIDGVEKDFPGGYGPDVVCDHACRFVERHKDRPFLLYWPMILAHCPFEPTPDSADWDPKSPGADSYKGNPRHFPDMVAYLDKLVGRLVKTLETNGVRENTLILFLGDNGTDQPIVSRLGDGTVQGGKGKTTEAGMHVPCLANWPGRTPRGRVCRDLVDTTDFLPTLCAAAGIPLPDTLRPDGRSFLPQLKGEPGTPREWLYCWYSRNAGPEATEFARTHRWKLYRTGEFFDLSADLLEQRPLAESALDAEARQARAKLQAVFPLWAEARGSALRPTDREPKPGPDGNAKKKSAGTKKAKKKAAAE
jgi:arylsulfatase A